ncbi:MAG: hypothetical protein L3J65_10790 [Robiginitomaculum sp.]|nr:hypothetical protein [Robiginitomaculum sp.]
MKNIFIIGAALLLGVSHSSQAGNVDFDSKHKLCLEKIADDAETAYEDAMIWQSEGGGRRARHCVALALVALGHPGEAAFRLEKIAKAPDGGSPNMRAGFYAEAANFWLEAGEPRKAYDASSAGLKIARSDVNLRIVRAQAYGALGHWDYAQTELTSALAFHPGDARALRFRAQSYFKQNLLKLAKVDIERSLVVNGTNIDALLLYGEIKEAMRLDAPQVITIQK